MESPINIRPTLPSAIRLLNELWRLIHQSPSRGAGLMAECLDLSAAYEPTDKVDMVSARYRSFMG